MEPQSAYTHWAAIYDSNDNKTRDLEAAALQQELACLSFNHIIEAGCGTGKNTAFLAGLSGTVTAVDLTPAMLQIARKKITIPEVQFLEANLQQPWHFAPDGSAGLVVFSLVLEHISNLYFVFREAAKKLESGGFVYVGELHPVKQYLGSKARFETESGVQVVDCFTHHVSEFLEAAGAAGFRLVALNEYFDDAGRSGPPRILTLLLRKRQ